MRVGTLLTFLAGGFSAVYLRDPLGDLWGPFGKVVAVILVPIALGYIAGSAK